MSEALKLWEEWFERDGDPWVKLEVITYCYFCLRFEPDHADDCIYLRAKKLVTKPKQYIVLGMHRSGTSLVAHLLKEMGVFMGDEFLEPDESNLLGYWEDVDFLALNKQILASLDGNWQTPFSRKEILVAQLDFEERIQAMIGIRNHKHLVWGWKDPRTTMLVWLYHEYLSDPHYIIVRREPTEIIDSLIRVHGGDVEYWDMLQTNYWQHVRDFISNTPDVKYIQVSYNNLMCDGMSRLIVRELASFVGNENLDIAPCMELIKC